MDKQKQKKKDNSAQRVKVYRERLKLDKVKQEEQKENDKLRKRQSRENRTPRQMQTDRKADKLHKYLERSSRKKPNEENNIALLKKKHKSALKKQKRNLIREIDLIKIQGLVKPKNLSSSSLQVTPTRRRKHLTIPVTSTPTEPASTDHSPSTSDFTSALWLVKTPNARKKAKLQLVEQGYSKRKL